jgi:uncharacterized protein (TIGR03437 family)
MLKLTVVLAISAVLPYGAQAQPAGTNSGCLPSGAGELQTPGISLYFEPGITDAQISSIRMAVSDANRYFTTRLGSRVVDAAIFVFSRVDFLTEAYATAFGLQRADAARVIGLMNSRGGSFANPQRAFLNLPAMLQNDTPLAKTVAHELFHVLQFQASGISASCLGSLTWLIEGSAEVAAFRTLDYTGAVPYPTSTNRALGIAEPLNETLRNSTYDPNGSIYSKWFLAVDQLIQSQGVTSVTKYFTQLNAQTAPPNPFREAFGIEEASFYQNFDSSWMHRYENRGRAALEPVCRGLPGTSTESGPPGAYFYTFYLRNSTPGSLNATLPTVASGWARNRTNPLLVSVFVNPLTPPGSYPVRFTDQSGQVFESLIEHSLSPNSAPKLAITSGTEIRAGSVGQAVTMSASDAACNATVTVNRNGVTETVPYLDRVGGAFLVPGSELVNPGKLSIVVANPPPGGGTSQPALITITGPEAPTPISTADAIVNAASFVGGAISPGELVTIFGAQFADAGTAISGQLTSEGKFPVLLGKSQALLNGEPVPLLFAGESQITAVVPYTAAVKAIAEVSIRRGDAVSAPMYLPVRAAFPGIFTTTQIGVGQAAAINEDNTLNSLDRPARRGGVVVLYATGEGLVSPAIEAGRLIGPPLPRPSLSVGVQVAGQPAEILYAGGAPGLVSGLLQVNFRVPGSVPAGRTEVTLSVGNSASRKGVSIYVAP